MKRYFTWIVISMVLISIFVTFHNNNGRRLLSDSELRLLGFSTFEKINPNMQIYFFKRMTEEINNIFKFSEEDKEKSKFKLLDKRFRELVFIINSKKTSFLPENINRYNGYIGVLKLEYPVIKPVYKKQVKKYIQILEVLRDRYPANSPHWLSIQQAIDTTRSLE